MALIKFQTFRKHRQTERQKIWHHSENKNFSVIHLHVLWRISSFRHSWCIQLSVSMGFTSLLYNAHLITFLGLKWLVCGIGHSASFSTEIKESVELYHYSVYGF